MAISNNNTGIRTGVCTSSTRPTAPYEGQMIYETDTDMVAIWNCTAWRYIAATTPTNGTVLQIVQGTTNTTGANSTTTLADTGLTATITPKSNTNKVLVVVQQSFSKSAGNTLNAIVSTIMRDATTIYLSQGAALYTGSLLDHVGASASAIYLDSPATTSATTYKTQYRNYTAAASVGCNPNSASATITLLEISA